MGIKNQILHIAILTHIDAKNCESFHISTYHYRSAYILKVVLQRRNYCVFNQLISRRNMQNLAIHAQEMPHAQLNFKGANPISRTDETLRFIVHLIQSLLDL